MEEEVQTGRRTQEEPQRGEKQQHAGESNAERRGKVREGQREIVFGTM